MIHINTVDTKYSEFLRVIIGKVIEDVLSRSSIVNEEILNDLMLVECMERISYEDLVSEVEQICIEVANKEARKLLNMLNE